MTRSRFRPRARRVVQLTTAFTVLALPASAFALPNTTSAESNPSSNARLSAQVTPRHLRLGREVHVAGRAVGQRTGTTVALEEAANPHARWRRLASIRIGRHGAYRLHAALRHSGIVRTVEVPAHRVGPRSRLTRGRLTTSSARQPAAVSPTAAVEVKAALRVPVKVHDVVVGHRTVVAGHLLPGRAGRVVRLQDRSGHRWRTIARAVTGRRGGFSVTTTPRANSALRVVFAGDRHNARATTGAGSLDVLSPVTVSWYDDAGLTGCGFHAVYGIANKTLPCGTKVRLSRGGRSVTATVDDRGPYIAGRDYDLNQTTAAALGFSGVGTVDASVQ